MQLSFESEIPGFNTASFRADSIHSLSIKLAFLVIEKLKLIKTFDQQSFDFFIDYLGKTNLINFCLIINQAIEQSDPEILMQASKLEALIFLNQTKNLDVEKIFSKFLDKGIFYAPILKDIRKFCDHHSKY